LAHPARWVSLDSAWEFRRDLADQGLADGRAEELAGPWPEQITVPYAWEGRGIGHRGALAAERLVPHRPLGLRAPTAERSRTRVVAASQLFHSATARSAAVDQELLVRA
jgi:hypothetical protein